MSPFKMEPLALPILLLAALFGADSPLTPKSRGIPMIRAFNAFQLVTFFAAMPYILAWLGKDPFTYAGGAFWVAIVVYVVLFGAMCVGMFNLTERE